MEQDLFSWLNSQKKLQETGLLVAPLSPKTTAQDSDRENQTDDSESVLEDSNLPIQNQTVENRLTPSESSQQEETAYFQNESAIAFHSPKNEIHEEAPAIQNQTVENQLTASESSQQEETAYFQNESAITFQTAQNESGHDEAQPIQNYTAENQFADSELSQQETTAYFQNESAITFQPSQNEPAYDEDIQQNHEWQERATGFTLSLDEPPPELWTHINDDDPDPEYEPTDSLQGAAYVQIHGRNFTERLHHTLKHSKERAEERAQENDNPPSKTLMQMAVILCGTLVIAMIFALLTLWFVWRETPDGMKRRAESFVEAGNFDEASEIYRKAHRRYPDKTEFLAGLSESSEKAGHPQTAKAARDEYRNKTESKDIPPAPETKPQAHHVIPKEKPMTFTDYLNEGNYAYNIGMYNRAVTNFFRAMNINSRDIRPYIGLSSCYRMKGMYFDSYRIIEEARRIFGRSPAVDMCIYFLREAK